MAKSKKITIDKNIKNIIKELGDEKYTVEYIERCINLSDDVIGNPFIATMAASATGYYLACTRLCLNRLHKKLKKGGVHVSKTLSK